MNRVEMQKKNLEELDAIKEAANSSKFKLK
jgi:hypothetical protein